jgi:hypothetical protein
VISESYQIQRRHEEIPHIHSTWVKLVPVEVGYFKFFKESIIAAI